MKGSRLIINSGLLLFFALMWFSTSSSSGGRSAGSCQGCHTGSPVFSDIEIQGIPTAYVPGQTYTGKLVMKDGDGVVGGFFLQANIGSLGIVSGQGVRTGGVGLTHIAPKAFDTFGDSIFWEFTWTAPASASGTADFSYWGNAANGNGANSGDVIHQNSSSVALPLEWGDFQVTANKNYRQLRWTTYSEVNNEGFSIQRSTDGRAYTDIGALVSKGDNVKNEYQYIDMQPAFADRLYYRIKQTDLDGRYTYSDIVSVTIESQEDIRLYPNPASTGVRLRIEGTDAATHIFITNGVGQVMSMSGDVRGITTPQEQGIYYVSFMKQNEVLSTKQLIVQ